VKIKRASPTKTSRRAKAETPAPVTEAIWAEWERLAPLQQRVMARPATGLAADKAFFDDLNGTEQSDVR